MSNFGQFGAKARARGGYAAASFYRNTTALGLCMAGALAAPAQAGGALPSNGQYVAGQGSISGTSSSVTVNQASSRGIINWGSFSVGAGNQVLFNNGNGATLNRVTGGDLSRIDGSLRATGSVYLINPQGIVIGPGGQVIANGSFVASTRDVSDNAFMRGGPFAASGTSNGGILNQGVITSNTGDAILVGSSVTNTGSISAPSGTVGLAAGNEIMLQPAGSDPRIAISGGTGSVTNAGNIRAAQAELNAAGGNVYALVENNGGAISATGTQTINGHVWLTASGTVRVAGNVTAQNANGSGGDVTVRGYDINIPGNINASASAANGAGGTVSIIASNSTTISGGIHAGGGATGQGGAIETSGHTLSFGGSHIDAGKGGSWLLDPVDLTVDGAAATTIDASLNGGTSVTLQTTATGASGPGNQNASGNGDINIQSAISWNTGATLTLDGYHSINITAPITVQANGQVVLTTNDGGTGGDLSFGLGPTGFAGNIQFTGTEGSGQSLTINGNAYTLLYSLSEVQSINSNLTGTYALADSINASGVGGWVPLGTNGHGSVTNSGLGFAGTFEGLGNTISNLSVNAGSSGNAGAFGALSGLIRDLNVGNVKVRGGLRTGGLVGWNTSSATILYDSVSGTVSGASQVGGLVGWNDGSIAGSSVQSGSVTGTGYGTGGFVGYNTTFAGVQTSAVSHVTVNGAGGVGGFAGLSTGTLSSDSVSSSTINDSQSTTGGFIGQNAASGHITSGAVTSTVVNGSNQTGGFVGLNSGAIAASGISTSTSGGAYSVSGIGYVGGFAGENIAGGTITNSSSANTGTTAVFGSGNRIGGFVGWNAGSLTGDQAADAVIGVAQVGGFVGWNDASITGATVQNASVIGTGYGTGGFVGYNRAPGNIQTSTVATSTVGGAGGVGGFVGLNTGMLSSDGVSGSIVSDVGYSDTGGFAGQNAASGNISNSSVTTLAVNGVNSSDTTVVNGTNYTGGFVGANAGAISNASVSLTEASTTPFGAAPELITAATATCACAVDVGGFAGANLAGGTITGSSVGVLIETVGSYPVVYSPGGTRVGGFAGWNAGELDHDRTGSTTRTGPSGVAVEAASDAGGLVGWNDGTIIHSAAINSGVGYSFESIGGLVGYNSTTGMISQSYADSSGAFGGSANDVGGLVGYNRGTITNAYATNASAGGLTNVGGLVGANGGTINNVYAAGTVSYGTGPLGPIGPSGAIVGLNLSTGIITNAYYDSPLFNAAAPVQAGLSRIVPAAGLNLGTLNAVAMGDPGEPDPTQQSTYVGFDFTNVWTIAPGKLPTLLHAP
jgi:filamentous hemagglutinin family protein